ncbi:centromere protein R isoform X2 [Loxodonta africana]|uniref:centromere protein R isoform X2 n=1 Tax=Loxodonta africana TaxID=9785 RepID=UPI0030CD02FE
MAAHKFLRPQMLLTKSLGLSKIQRKKNVATYSPITGTCQMSPCVSPISSKEQERRNGPSNGKREKLNNLNSRMTKRKESTTNNNDEFMMLLSKVEKSSEKIMEIMQNLSSIQALEDRKELENLIGISCASSCLKREMQKTKELMTKVTKQKLFEKRSAGLSKKDLKHKTIHWVDTDGMSHYHHMNYVTLTAMNSLKPV